MRNHWLLKKEQQECRRLLVIIEELESTSQLVPTFELEALSGLEVCPAYECVIGIC